jgi:hypothetical protein
VHWAVYGNKDLPCLVVALDEDGVHWAVYGSRRLHAGVEGVHVSEEQSKQERQANDGVCDLSFL